MTPASDSADPRIATRPITRIAGGRAERGDDAIAVERALEIRVGGRALAVTLCTPSSVPLDTPVMSTMTVSSGS